MATISSRILPLRESSKTAGEEETFQPTWHRSAPKEVSRAERWSGGSDGWAAWSAHLGRRRTPRAVAELLGGKTPSLSWALAAPAAPLLPDRPATLELLAALDRLERRGRWKLNVDPVELAMHWSSDGAHRQGPAFGLECLGWCRALPALASLLPASSWWRMFHLLFSTAEDAVSDDTTDALTQQWLRAELPLTIAYLFPEISAARKLARGGAKALQAVLSLCLTDDGMPLSGNLPIARTLLASMARSRALAQRLKKPCWNNAAEDRYTAFIEQTLRLLRRDGTMSLTDERPAACDRELLALALGGVARRTRAAARQSLTGEKCAAERLPEPAANNEKAGVCVLRPDWGRSGARVAVARRGDELHTELSVGRDRLWSGAWTCSVQRDGTPLAPATNARWEETCWVSNPDADYLELELQLAEGVRVERQILLAREDRFLFMADAVLAEEPAEWAYRSVLPLGEHVAFDPSTESREGYLVGRKARGLVFPLALPEWRAEPSGGSCEMSEAGLEVRATGRNVCRLYAPLVIDLDPRRLFHPATWRRLTIAEWLSVVSPDLAAGYRLHVRGKQWLIYRSLGPRGNRTVLGQNLVSEFLVARFLSSGEIEPLVEIE